MRAGDHSVRIRYLKGLVLSAIGLAGLFYSSLLMQGCDPASLMGRHFPSLYAEVGGVACEYHTFTAVHEAIVNVSETGEAATVAGQAPVGATTER